jgi:hypothetical protein
LQAYAGATLKDTAISTATTHLIYLINLPAGTPLTIKANKAGYTLGAQPFASITIPAGGAVYDLTTRLSLGPSKNIQAVLDWSDGVDNLDLFLWMPNGTSIGGVVGSGASGHADDLGPGLLTDFPRARWNRDGGAGDGEGTESISIVTRPGFPASPYYISGTMTGQGYDFLVTDHGTGDLNKPVVFRYWVGGALKATVFKSDTCDTNGADNILGNADDEIWWKAGYVGRGDGANFHGVDSCGSAGTIQPYADPGGMGIILRP